MFLTYDHTGDSLGEQPVFLHAPRRWGHETRDETPGGGGGGVLQRILDRGVPRRFVNPNPTFGLRKRKLVPFLRPKAEK